MHRFIVLKGFQPELAGVPPLVLLLERGVVSSVSNKCLLGENATAALKCQAVSVLVFF